MKNERLARAMTQIDYALIEEAAEMPRRKVMSSELFNRFVRYGSIAACMLLVVGVLLLGTKSSPDLLLYGEEITTEARLINEYIPRSVAYSVEPAELASQSIPMELNFRKSTRLTLEDGEMIVLDDHGDVLYCGGEYVAKGETSLCLSLPEGAKKCVISTDRGYKIVLNMDSESGLWCVNIEK